MISWLDGKAVIPKVGGHRICQDTQCYGSQVIFETYRSQQFLYSDILTETQTHRSLSSVTLCNHESAEMHAAKVLLNLVNIACIDPCRNAGMQKRVVSSCANLHGSLTAQSFADFSRR